jgi:predicted thioesterase
MEELKPGLVGEVSEFVTEQLTAASIKSGLVSAYATPAMTALMENASVLAIQKFLPKGHTSVGAEMCVKHIAPTPVGVRVHARSQVLTVDGRKVTFQVEAWDHQEKIGEGTHIRVIVDAARFKDKIETKLKT